ncbi:MAG: ubiquinone/menaquinone biosynthesis methyltransferase [Actinobacteria bacterium]|nr:ubiquinone/menaquinone biosynthesis methyltransferase [Actinomycetota bacterium]
MSRRAPPERQVESMFDEVAARYDLVNSILSLGLDGWWRRVAARSVEVTPFRPVLDLGCGTGRLAGLLAGEHPVVGVDLSREMLAAARVRLAPRGRVDLVRGSAFRLPFADASFAGAASAFVMRNLDDLPAAFAELARVVEPGGRLAMLDMTEPRHPLVRRGFRAYFGAAAPALGGIAGKREAYEYLVRSLAQLPPRDALARMLEEAGFAGARWRGLFPGTVTLWTAVRAVRPTEPPSDDRPVHGTGSHPA